jgi:hypothetical protein
MVSVFLVRILRVQGCRKIEQWEINEAEALMRIERIEKHHYQGDNKFNIEKFKQDYT